MLDMGFEPQIRRIVEQEGMPHGRQTFMFRCGYDTHTNTQRERERRVRKQERAKRERESTIQQQEPAPPMRVLYRHLCDNIAPLGPAAVAVQLLSRPGRLALTTAA